MIIMMHYKKIFETNLNAEYSCKYVSTFILDHRKCIIGCMEAGGGIKPTEMR